MISKILSLDTRRALMGVLAAGAALIMTTAGTLVAQGAAGNADWSDPQAREAAGLCAQPAQVSLAGQVVLRIHAPAAGKTCQQRADIVQQRIVDALSIGVLYPKDIHVQKQRGEWAIFVKDILIITADATSAKVNHTTAPKLAEMWANNLRKTLPESTPQKPGL
ncbi:MAG: hypothetical protein IT209_01190 [Armatimonadetes bacterium]|nr:hypothetical protein [Armatimonadota bacterium]